MLTSTKEIKLHLTYWFTHMWTFTPLRSNKIICRIQLFLQDPWLVTIPIRPHNKQMRRPWENARTSRWKLYSQYAYEKWHYTWHYSLHPLLIKNAVPFVVGANSIHFRIYFFITEQSCPHPYLCYWRKLLLIFLDYLPLLQFEPSIQKLIPTAGTGTN